MNKQVSYYIKIYGPVVEEGRAAILGSKCVAPSQLGLDFLRRRSAQYEIVVTQIKFPPELAEQDIEKHTLYVKLQQFQQQEDPYMMPYFFESSSETIKLKD